MRNFGSVNGDANEISYAQNLVWQQMAYVRTYDKRMT